MDDLTTEHRFDSQAMVIDVLAIFLTYYPCMFVQPDTGSRPVDWCRN